MASNSQSSASTQQGRSRSVSPVSAAGSCKYTMSVDHFMPANMHTAHVNMQQGQVQAGSAETASTPNVSSQSPVARSKQPPDTILIRANNVSGPFQLIPSAEGIEGAPETSKWDPSEAPHISLTAQQDFAVVELRLHMSLPPTTLPGFKYLDVKQYLP